MRFIRLFIKGNQLFDILETWTPELNDESFTVVIKPKDRTSVSVVDIDKKWIYGIDIFEDSPRKWQWMKLHSDYKRDYDV